MVELICGFEQATVPRHVARRNWPPPAWCLRYHCRI